jgi:hypothetical protein
MNVLAPNFGSRFRVILELGRGGMAEVWLAVQVGAAKTSKLVVIKNLRSTLAEDPEFIAMFLDEARLAARLVHPNVVALHEAVEESGRCFLSMEYLDGQPLHRVLARGVRRGTPLPTAMRLRVLCDVLAGLHYAHELRDFDGAPLHVTHRDVTPENVFVTYAGDVKLVDFGIAKASGRSVETKLGVVKGKVPFMSPEQATGGSKQVDRRTDVFAVGVMLWETLAQRPFWAGKDSLSILHALIEGKYDPSPRAVDPTIDAELDRVCRMALAHDVDQRFPTAQAFREALEEQLERVGPRADNAALGEYVARMFESERQTTREAIESALAELRGEVVPKATPPAPSAQPGHRVGVRDEASIPSAEDVRAASSRNVRLGMGLAVIGAAAIVAGVGIASGRSQPPADHVSFRVSVAPDHARLKVGEGAWTTNPYAGDLSRIDADTTIQAEAEGYEPRSVRVRLDRDRSVRVVLRKKGAQP